MLAGRLVFWVCGVVQENNVLRKDAGLYCGPRLRKGEVFVYVGSIQNLKDLKDLKDPPGARATSSNPTLGGVEGGSTCGAKKYIEPLYFL